MTGRDTGEETGRDAEQTWASCCLRRGSGPPASDARANTSSGQLSAVAYVSSPWAALLTATLPRKFACF